MDINSPRLSKIRDRIEDYTEVETALMIPFLLAFVFLTRFALPLQDNSLREVAFSSTSGYLTYQRSHEIAQTLTPNFLSDQFTYPFVEAARTGFVYELFIGLQSAILGGSPETTAMLLKIYTVVFFAIAVVMLYFLVKELTSSEIAVLSSVLFVAFPGSTLTNSVATSGSVFSFELALLFTTLYFVNRLLQYVNENPVLFTDTGLLKTGEDLPGVRRFWTLFVGSVLFTSLYAWTQIHAPMVLAGVFFITGFFYVGMWSENRKNKEHIQGVLFLLSSALVASTALRGAVIDFPIGEIYSYTFAIIFVASTTLALALWWFITVKDIPTSVSQFVTQSNRNEQLFARRRISWAIFFVSGAIPAAVAISERGWSNIREYMVGASGSQPLQVESYYQIFQPLTSQNVQNIFLSEFGTFAYVGLIGLAAYVLLEVYDAYSGYVTTREGVLIGMGIAFTVPQIFATTFMMYFAVVASVFSAILIHRIFEYVDLTDTPLNNLKGYQIIIVVMVLVLFIPTLVYPVSGTVAVEAQSTNVESGSWGSTAEFLSEIESESDDEDAVAITWRSGSPYIGATEGVRTTSYSQQSAEFASKYLLSTTEDNADKVLDEYNTGENPEYIVINSNMAYAESDFGWIAETHPDYTARDFFTPVYNQDTGRYAFGINEQKYYESLLVRMYFYHGSAYEQQPIAVTYQKNTVRGQEFAVTKTTDGFKKTDHVQKFDSIRKANQYVNPTDENGDPIETNDVRHVGGVGLHAQEPVPALEQHRYIGSSEQDIRNSRALRTHAQTVSEYSSGLTLADFIIEGSETKVFERVEGATISGSGAPPNSRVRVLLTLTNENTGQQFRYIQITQSDKNGNFEMRVPYSSTGTPEEYHVQPVNAEYHIISQQIQLSAGEDGELQQTVNIKYSSVEVTEEQVQTGDNPESVELEKISRERLAEILGTQQKSDNEQN